MHRRIMCFGFFFHLLEEEFLQVGLKIFQIKLSEKLNFFSFFFFGNFTFLVLFKFNQKLKFNQTYRKSFFF